MKSSPERERIVLLYEVQIYKRVGELVRRSEGAKKTQSTERGVLSTSNEPSELYYYSIATDAV